MQTPLLSNISYAATVSVLFVFVFISRSVYSWISWSIARDGYAHLHLIQDIRDEAHRIPRKPSKTATSGVYGYPFLMHWVLSFVPSRFDDTVDRYFSGSLDLMFSVVLISLVPLGVLGRDQLLLALVLFLTTPGFVRPDASHGKGLSARKPGLLLTTLSLLTLSLWFTTGSLVYLLSSVFFGGLVFLTSKFGLQAYLFVSLGLAVAFSYVALVAVLFAFVFATLVSGGRYLMVGRGHLRHLYEYAVSKQFKVSYAKPDVSLPGFPTFGSFRELLETVYRSKALFPVFNYPILLAFLAGFVLVGSDMTDPGLLHIFIVWIFAGVLTFVVTSLPYLRFLGQAERYLEYVYLPMVVYVAKAWGHTGPTYRVFVAAMVLMGAATIFTYFWVYREVFRDDREEAEALDDVVRFLQRFEESTVLVQPIWKGRRIAWDTGHEVVDLILNGASTRESVKELDFLFPEDYGIVTSDVSGLEDRYDPDWVVFDVSESDEYGEGNLRLPTDDPDYENEKYEVYSFNQLKG